MGNVSKILFEGSAWGMFQKSPFEGWIFPKVPSAAQPGLPNPGRNKAKIPLAGSRL